MLRDQIVCENKEEADPAFVALEAIILHNCDPEKNPIFQCKTDMDKRVEELVINTGKCNIGKSSDYPAIARKLFGDVWMETRLAETRKEIKKEFDEWKKEIKEEFDELKKEIKKLVEKRPKPSDEEGEEETEEEEEKIDKKIRQDLKKEEKRNF